MNYIMKTTILLLAVMLSGIISANAQEERQATLEDFKQIEKLLTIDDNGNITYVKIIEIPVLSKDEIYSRANNYFVYNYGSGKSVIQTEDKEKGTLVGKGTFHVYSKFMPLISTTYEMDVWHILRIDAKDGRARIIFTLTNYDVSVNGQVTEMQITTSYPFYENKRITKTVKNMYLQSIFNANVKALSILNKIEDSLKNGNTSGDIENEDW